MVLDGGGGFFFVVNCFEFFVGVFVVYVVVGVGGYSGFCCFVGFVVVLGFCRIVWVVGWIYYCVEWCVYVSGVEFGRYWFGYVCVDVGCCVVVCCCGGVWFVGVWVG